MTVDSALFFRNVYTYIALTMATVVGLTVTWGLLMGIQVQVLAAEDPALAALMEEAQRKQPTDMALVPKILAQAAPRMDWVMLAAATSLLVFPVVGWMAGRWAPDPTWAGCLPLLDLLAGVNPAHLSLEGLVPAMPMAWQVGLLVGQILLVQAVAAWASRGRR